MNMQRDQHLIPQDQENQAYRRHIDSLYWAGVLIWAGVIFGAEAAGLLPKIGEATGWSWVFFGAGVFSLLISLWHASSPNHANPKTGDWLWGIVLTLIGLGGLTTLDITWPLILVALGAVMLINGFREDR